MTNDQMTANRYLRWYQARRKLAAIQQALQDGCTIMVSTHLKATQYTAKHADMFKATRTGLFVKRGKHWDCIDYCKITVYK